MIVFLLLSSMFAQAVFALLLRDDSRNDVVFEACVRPGGVK